MKRGPVRSCIAIVVLGIAILVNVLVLAGVIPDLSNLGRVMDTAVAQVLAALRSPTPEPTETPDDCSVGAPALPEGKPAVITAIEVTQGIQDLNQSVPLFEGRQTLVRLHARSCGPDDLQLDAELHIAVDGTPVAVLEPNNAGATIVAEPDRGNRDQSFQFELPTDILGGELELRGVLVGPRDAPESTPDSLDEHALAVGLTPAVPTPDVLLVPVTFSDSGKEFKPTNDDMLALRQFVDSVYPVSGVHYSAPRDLGLDGVPEDCGDVNFKLSRMKAYDCDLLNASGSSGCPSIEQRRYYGMVAAPKDAPFRGCAEGNGIASGATGSALGQDVNGTYADSYGAHEIGHTYGLNHAPACIDSEDESVQGWISATEALDELGRISEQIGTVAPGGVSFGADLIGANVIPVGTPQTTQLQCANAPCIVPPTFSDVMGYCPDAWISPYHYMKLARALKDAEATRLTSGVSSSAPRKHLLLTGVFRQSDLELDQPFPVDRHPFPGLPTPEFAGSPYKIEIRLGNTTVAEHTFEVRETHLDPQPGTVGTLEPLRYIAEAVPFDVPIVTPDPESTQRFYLQVIDPSGNRLPASFSADVKVPVLRDVTADVVGDALHVTWSTRSGDPTDASLADDEDPLEFDVSYSPGADAWRTLAVGITGEEIWIPTTNLPGSEDGRVRVRASDGFQTAVEFRDVDAPVHVAKIRILQPAAGSTFSSRQSVTFAADVFDADRGFLSGDNVHWWSSLDGHLGDGSRLTVTGLTADEHQISVRVDDEDAEGSVVTATIDITIALSTSGLDGPNS